MGVESQVLQKIYDPKVKTNRITRLVFTLVESSQETIACVLKTLVQLHPVKYLLSMGRLEKQGEPFCYVLKVSIYRNHLFRWR